MERVADFFSHLGWAFMGQECDCGSNPFNWFARFMQRFLPEDDWVEDSDTYRNWWQRAFFEVGCYFCDLGVKFYEPPTE